jgi:hypothetical protein
MNYGKPRKLQELGFAAVNYVAALLEGEGSFYANKAKETTRICISAMMGDLEPLKRLQAFCGGHIYGPTIARSKNHTPMFQWSLTTKNDCFALVKQLYKLMSPRRQRQIRNLLSYENRNR